MKQRCNAIVAVLAALAVSGVMWCVWAGRPEASLGEADLGVKVCNLGIVRPGGIAGTRLLCLNSSAHVLGPPQVSSSCGCSRANVVSGQTGPGADLVIAVDFDPEGRVGKQQQKIHMSWPGLAKLTLLVEAEIAPEVEMFPSYGLSSVVTRALTEAQANATCSVYLHLAKPVSKIDASTIRVSSPDAQLAVGATLIGGDVDCVRLVVTGAMPKSTDEVSGYVKLRYLVGEVWRELEVPLLVTRSSPILLSPGAVGPVGSAETTVQLSVICDDADVISGLRVVAVGQGKQREMERTTANGYKISVSALRDMRCDGIWVSSADGGLYEVVVLW
jgi:hypothetical protein